MRHPLVIAMVLSDEREVFRRYSSPEPSFGTAPAALLEGLAQSAGCEVHVISCLQHPVRSQPKIANNIYYHGLRVRKAGWLRTGYFGCVMAVRHLGQHIQADVAHGQGTERYCALSAAFSGLPSIVTIHGNMRRLAALSRARPFTFAWCMARLEAFVLPRTDGFICPSAHTQRQVQPAARRTWVVPNAVDPSFFDIKRYPDPTPTLLCVANILPLKNQIGLIETLDEVAAREPFRIIFAGALYDTEYSHRFRRLVDARPWCEYAGIADRSRLRQLLSSATALILPSFEENCPMAILEAMAAGLPVLASNIGGIPELVTDGEFGMLFDPTDPAAVRNAVTSVLCAPSRARSFGEAGRMAAQRRFDPKAVAASHLDIYQELMAEGKNSSQYLSKTAQK